MNKWMLRVICFMASSSVMATSFAKDAAECKEMSEAARNIMSARQSGVSMSSLIEMTGKAPEEIKATASKIISDAFEQPRVTDPVLKDRTISEFENKWFLSCYKKP
ncbi:hypothetical protein IZT72_07510 [Pseudomonas brenneri]|uniref:hypothetical protein n=1 Tax=Pseudomonas brenneri TaxID=129817 RepID=UPI0018A2B479|nr:hypothetical protein [Pseudomonas brenneri]MBF8004443.1 hypothetical protein [Pseudomonas brenneri]